MVQLPPYSIGLPLPASCCLESAPSHILPAGVSAEAVLRARYGAKGKELLNLARMYDKYVAWHNTNYFDTPDDSAKERAALASAVAGVRVFLSFLLSIQVSSGEDSRGPVSYTHLTLPTTPYV